MRKQVVNLSVDKLNNKILFKAKRYEDLELHLVIDDNKRPYMLEGYELVTLYIKQGEEVAEYPAEKILGNDIYFKLEKNFLSEIGIAECELNITNLDGTLKTSSFFGLIQESLSGIAGLETFYLMDSEGYYLIDSSGYKLKVRG